MAAAPRSVYDLSLNFGDIDIGKKQLVIEPVYFCSAVRTSINWQGAKSLTDDYAGSHKHTSRNISINLLKRTTSMQTN